jgi:hypothetical protein
VAILLVAILYMSAWYFGRRVNYALGYQNMVQNEIKNMVKPEALK